MTKLMTLINSWVAYLWPSGQTALNKVKLLDKLRGYDSFSNVGCIDGCHVNIL